MIVNILYMSLFCGIMQCNASLFVLSKGTMFLPQTLIFQSFYLCDPISETFEIADYEFC